MRTKRKNNRAEVEAEVAVKVKNLG